jgi:hypothetical protein
MSKGEASVNSRPNPLKLNPLQLRTLTILQELAHDPSHALPPESSGAIAITNLPHPHGDHFHVGNFVVATRDASGLFNEAVWKVLERKGLARAAYPRMIALTAEGIAYETGIRHQVLHGGHH